MAGLLAEVGRGRGLRDLLESPRAEAWRYPPFARCRQRRMKKGREAALEVVYQRYSIPALRVLTRVPALPSVIATMSASEPITASLPVARANSMAAWTFGPMEPAAKPRRSSSSGWAWAMAFWVGLPQST